MSLRHLPLLLAFPAAMAQADTLYKCIDSSGHTTYTNQKAGARNCSVLSQDQPVSTLSAPPRRAATPSPSDFPRVSEDQQKSRDGDRRAILQQELATEQRQLEESKKALAEQEGRIEPTEHVVGGGINGAKVEARLKPYRDAVALHEKNIEALNKEIGSLR